MPVAVARPSSLASSVAEVERRAALQRHARAQERVRLERFEEAEQAEHLLESVEAEAVLCGNGLDLFCTELHAMSSQDRSRTRSGTMRFQRATSLPPLR